MTGSESGDIFPFDVINVYEKYTTGISNGTNGNADHTYYREYTEIDLLHNRPINQYFDVLQQGTKYFYTLPRACARPIK